MNIFDLLPAELANAVLEFVSVDEPVRAYFETSVLPWIEKKEVAFSKTSNEWCTDCFRAGVSTGEHGRLCELCVDEDGTETVRKMSFAEFEAREREQIRVCPYAETYVARSKMALCGFSVMKNAYRNVNPAMMYLSRSHNKSCLIEELEAIIACIPRWEAYELAEMDAAGWILANSSDVAREKVADYFADNVGAYLQVAEESCV